MVEQRARHIDSRRAPFLIPSRPNRQPDAGWWTNSRVYGLHSRRASGVARIAAAARKDKETRRRRGNSWKTDNSMRLRQFRPLSSADGFGSCSPCPAHEIGSAARAWPLSSQASPELRSRATSWASLSPSKPRLTSSSPMETNRNPQSHLCVWNGSGCRVRPGHPPAGVVAVSASHHRHADFPRPPRSPRIRSSIWRRLPRASPQHLVLKSGSESWSRRLLLPKTQDGPVR